MSIQLQSMSTVLSVSPEKTELLTVIKNEPEIVEIGINDILDSSDEDEEIIPDIKDIDIVSHELSEDLIKSETVSENTFENNHSESVETQVFVKTENTPLTEKENITQSEYLYKTQDISDGNVSRGTSQGVIEVQGSNEHFTALRSDKQFVNFFKDSSDISRKAKCPNKTVFPECYKIVETTLCKKDRRKEKVIEEPVILIEPLKYTSLAKIKHAGNTNKSTPKQNKKRYCCEICTYTSGSSSNFKRHQLTHKTKAEIDDRLLKYRCDKCKYKTYTCSSLKKHKLMHLKSEEIPYFYCYHCLYKCKQKGNLRIHIFNHFKNQEVPFHCYICDFMTLERNLMTEHFKKHPKHHSKCDETDFKNQFETYAKYHCDKCKYKTCSSGYFKRHKLMHLKSEEIPYFYCYHCLYKCKQKGSLKRHIFNHFEKEEVPFHCYICDFTTLKRNFIIEHFKKHSKHHSKCDETDYKNQFETYTKYHCDKCKYKTCLSGNFQRHKLKHLKPEEIPYFYCYHCPYKCKEKSSLKRHIFNHFEKEEVPFHCYICNFTTLKTNLFIEHFKKHLKHHNKSDETDYKNQFETYTKYRCNKCKYKTCWSSRFKRHKLKHLKPEEIPYFYCYHCSFKSKRKGNFKIHIFNHFKKEEVTFHCYICDFTTLKRNLIINHFKKHSKHHSKCNETDYKNQYETYTKYRCDKCKYKTFLSGNFKIHKLNHLKPEQIPYFYCYHCPYKCAIKNNLKTHIFRHFKNENVPFHCYICDFTTLKRNFIIEHFKKHSKHHSKCNETDYKNQFETFTKYRCDKCKYKTCVSGNFNRHKLKHLKPEEIQYFYCYHCSYKSKWKYSLKPHIFRHFEKEEIPFHCYICDFTTLKKNLIIEHFKNHPKHHSKCDETDYKNQFETYTKKRMR